MHKVSPSVKTGRRLVIGLNPAWQKTLLFNSLHKGEVNRAETSQGRAGGKGVHTVKACGNMNKQAILVQFAGGVTGEMLTRDLERQAIDHLTIETSASTRVCTTLLDRTDGSMTELIEPSPTITRSEADALGARLYPVISNCHALALCGTLPLGVPADLYRDIVLAAHDLAWVIVDAHLNLDSTLQAGPHILKINAMELSKLTGIGNQPQAARKLLTESKLLWVAVTTGADEAVLYSRHRQWNYQIPKLAQAINPLGAGDTATGILLAEIESLIGPRPQFAENENNYRAASERVMDGFRLALAAASASCLKAEAAAITRDDAEKMKPRIQVKESFYQKP